MIASEIATLLNARRIGKDRWMAYCPAHPDHNASLQIRAGNKAVLLKCWSHDCSPKEIVAAMGLSLSDLWYVHAWTSDRLWEVASQLKAKYPKLSHRPSKKLLGSKVATYRYTDEHGELVGEKMRFTIKGETGKMFLWRVPQLGGGWKYREPENPPLYRLHEVAGARFIVLAEGEKDCDNLSKLCKSGVMAVTTAPNGSQTWSQKYAAWFAGKKVVILPDNDAPGKAYADAAYRDILSVAKSVKIINLPVPPKEDVSWYLEHHSPAELKHCILESNHARSNE